MSIIYLDIKIKIIGTLFKYFLLYAYIIMVEYCIVSPFTKLNFRMTLLVNKMNKVLFLLLQFTLTTITNLLC